MIYSQEEISSEKGIIEIIKYKELKEIKEFFKENDIKIKQLNYLNNVAKYLIEKNFTLDIIKFIIEQQQQHYRKQQQSINNTELLFHSIECNNYETAKLLLNIGTRITNWNTESKNIIEYFVEKRKLDSKKLLFILNIVKDASLMTSDVLCKIIRLNEPIYIKEILHYKYFDTSFILNLLFDYKNKTKLSKKELQNIVNNLNQGIIKINNKTKDGNYLIFEAINNNNIEIVKLLIKYANKNRIILELNEKDMNGNTPILEAIKMNYIEIVKLLMKY